MSKIRESFIGPTAGKFAVLQQQRAKTIVQIKTQRRRSFKIQSNTKEHTMCVSVRAVQTVGWGTSLSRIRGCLSLSLKALLSDGSVL